MQGWQLSNYFGFSSQQGFALREKNVLTAWERNFLLDSFSKGTLCARKQTEGHKVRLLYIKIVKNLLGCHSPEAEK